MDEHKKPRRRSASVGLLVLVALAAIGWCVRDARAHSQPLLGSVLPTASAVADARATALEDTAPLACIKVRTEARYVPYGYNHVVILESKCEGAATCLVATDLNPTQTSVDVPAGVTLEVTTFIASPASSFVAHVQCEPRGRGTGRTGAHRG